MNAPSHICRDAAGKIRLSSPHFISHVCIFCLRLSSPTFPPFVFHISAFRLRLLTPTFPPIVSAFCLPRLLLLSPPFVSYTQGNDCLPNTGPNPPWGTRDPKLQVDLQKNMAHIRQSRLHFGLGFRVKGRDPKAQIDFVMKLEESLIMTPSVPPGGERGRAA